jgi:hypothetical protein
LAIDAAETDKLKDDPESFLREHFVKVVDYGTLQTASTWQALGGGAVARKYLGSVEGTLTLGAVPISADDCLEITAIQGRTPPTCYVGLEREPTKPNYYLARVRPDKQPGYRRVLYLSARANRITLLTLPTAGGPDLMFTDPLTGCAIYFGTVAGQEVVCHVNALALTAADSNQYMKNLKNAVPGFAKSASLKKGEYRGTAQALEQSARVAKQSMGRISVVAEASDYTTVLGVRVGGHWRIFYQAYADVMSTRTGIKKLVMGANSHKARIRLQQFS